MGQRYFVQNSQDDERDSTMTLRVMIVEADLEFAVLHQNALKNYGYEVDLCASGATALEWMESFSPNVLLVEDDLPDMTGAQFLKQVRARGYAIPAIIIIENGAALPAAPTFEEGINEFVIKEAHPAYLHYMAKSIFGAYRGHLIEMENRHLLDIVQRQNLELEEHRGRLRAYALADPATGFYHEATFLEILRKHLGQSRRNLRPLTVLQVGLDCLDPVRQTFGEEFTEATLRDVAARLAGVFRESDSMARLADGRYAVLLPDTPPENAVYLVQRLRARIEEMSYFDGVTNQRVTISAGVAGHPGPGIASAEAMMDQAARLLAQAQAQGGDRVLTSPPEETEAHGFAEAASLAEMGREITRWAEDLRTTRFEEARSLVQRLRETTHPMAHSNRATDLAVAIARRMGLPADRVDQIEMAALLHDLGMAAVPADLLDREGPLSASDRTLIERHPEWSLQIARALPFLQEELVLIRHHHERMDGTGYPCRLAGPAIPLGARILACADAMAAMTEPRPYRPAKTPKAALKEIRNLAGTWFDPEVVSALRAVAR